MTNGYLEKTVIDWIPGMPPIRLGDFSSFLRTTDPNDFGLRFNESEANKCAKAGALILNTFDGLEADVLAALRAEDPRIYTVGPLGSLLRQNLDSTAAAADSTGLSLWKQDAECLTWLDAQERQRSVVYVNFGSHTVLTPEQLAEFAWGLAASGHLILWCIRDNLVRGGGGGPAVLPPDFWAAAAGRCHVTAWCPQEQVLRHPARGLLPDAQRVELDVRGRGGRRADGVLAGVLGPVHQLQVRLRGVGRRRPAGPRGQEGAGRCARQGGHGERGDKGQRGEVEGGGVGGQLPRRVVV